MITRNTINKLITIPFAFTLVLTLLILTTPKLTHATTHYTNSTTTTQRTITTTTQQNTKTNTDTYRYTHKQQVKTIGEQATFNSDITINKDSSLTIVETIKFKTVQPRHGIYRYLPIAKYQIPKLISVTDENGNPYQVKTTKKSRNLLLRIGDPNQQFTDTKTYKIKYTYKYPLTKENGYHQILWNILGDRWTFPITSVTATITSPTDIKETKCYSGTLGSNDNLCQITTISNKQIAITYNKPTIFNKNLTVYLKIDSNNITPPPPLWLFIQNYLILILIPIPTIILAVIWYKIGRDERPDGIGKLKPFEKLPIPLTAYEPPKNLTPAQLGIILDSKIYTSYTTAEIVELARRKYIKIEKIKTGKIFKTTDYKFTKLKNIDNTLTKYQTTIMREMFSNTTTAINILNFSRPAQQPPQTTETTLSALKKTFYKITTTINKEMYESIEQYYTVSPKNRATYTPMSMALTIFTQLTIMAHGYNNGMLPHNPQLLKTMIISVAILFILDIMMSLKLYSYNAEGMKLKLYAQGFKQNLKRGAWRDKIKEKRLFFEEVIPYAIALRTIKKLAKDMQDLNIAPPEYMQGIATTGTNAFVKDISSFSRSITVTAPTRSSGGFSAGGGGGGGGGGSW